MVSIGLLSATVMKYGSIAIATGFGSMILEKIGKPELSQLLTIGMYVIMGVGALELTEQVGHDIYRTISSWRWHIDVGTSFR